MPSHGKEWSSMLCGLLQNMSDKFYLGWYRYNLVHTLNEWELKFLSRIFQNINYLKILKNEGLLDVESDISAQLALLKWFESIAVDLYLHSSLTSLSTVIQKELMAAHMIKKYIAFYGSSTYFTVFRRARHWPSSWARWFQLTPSTLNFFNEYSPTPGKISDDVIFAYK